MEKKQTIVFSVIGAAIVMGALLSLSYFGWSNGNFKPLPANDTETPVVNNNTVKSSDRFRVLPEPDPPTISDPGLKVEKVIEGLALPTSMAFLDHDEIVILQKDNGRV